MTTFTKQRRGAPAGFFEVEAAGLAWLDVPGGVPVAQVRSSGPDHLTLARVETAVPSAEVAARLGSQLAATHDAGADAFGVGPAGWSGDGFIGDCELSLRPEPSWGGFYARQRVLPYATSAARSGAIDARGLRVIETLAERLVAGEFDDDSPPARIHGDLWSGNVLFGKDHATLIDPAAHGGHRITDLAMLALFGLPFLAEVYAAYAAASTHLGPNWRDLIELHQLHPLLVHAVLFGGGYGAQAVRAAQSY